MRKGHMFRAIYLLAIATATIGWLCLIAWMALQLIVPDLF